jgi:hypothetical protein
VRIEEELADRWTPGEPSLFTLISWLNEQTHLWEIEPATAAAGANPEPHSPPARGEGERAGPRPDPPPAHDDEMSALMAAVRGRIVTGDPVVERKSTFQAHVCPLSSQREFQAFQRVLLENNKIRNATHNVRDGGGVGEG